MCCSSKVTAQMQQTGCILWFYQTISVTIVHVRFKTKSGVKQPLRPFTYAWRKQSAESGWTWVGSKNLPPRSLDFTRQDFAVGDISSPQVPENLDGLDVAIGDLRELLKILMLHNVWHETLTFDVCRVTNGACIKDIMWQKRIWLLSSSVTKLVLVCAQVC
jgi:hypothetical protein